MGHVPPPECLVRGPRRKPSDGSEHSDGRAVACRACQWRTCSSSAPGRPGSPRRSRWPPPAATSRARQGGVPARQVLRRRADDAGPARARDARLRSAAVADWQVVDGAVLRSPSGREVTVPLPPGPGTFAAVVPAAPARRRARRARREGRRHRRSRGTGSTATLVDRRRPRGRRRRRPRPDQRPLRHRRRRHVEPGAQGARTRRAGLPRRVARLPPVRPRRRPDRPREHLYVWFEADLLPGYAWSFPLPGGRANIGFGVLRDGTRRDPGHEAAVGRTCSTGPTSARRSGPTPRSRAGTRRGRSRPASTGRRSPAAGCCSPATRRRPPT